MELEAKTVHPSDKEGELLSVASSHPPFARSQVTTSQDNDIVGDPPIRRRRSQLLDMSPASSDSEDARTQALLRVKRRRQSSRRLTQLDLLKEPIFCPLDILICEEDPVSRVAMAKLVNEL